MLESRKCSYLGLNLETHRNLNINPQSWQLVNGWGKWISAEDRIDSYLSAIIEQAEALSQQGYLHLIISNESIFGTHKEFTQILGALHAKGYIINVIVVLRRPHEWIKSAYLQWAIVDKTYPGHIPPFSKWSSTKLPPFASELRRWIDDTSINKCSLINLDRCKNLIASFSSLIDIELDISSDIRVNEAREPYELYVRWLLGNHTRNPQPPSLANAILGNIRASEFQSSNGLSFSDLWDDLDIKDTLAVDCDRETSRLNSILSECGVEPFPLEANKPSKSFEFIKAKNSGSYQDDAMAIAFQIILKLQDSVSQLEKRLRSIENGTAKE